MARRTRALLALSCALTALAAGAPNASAGLLVPSAEECDEQVLEKPFTRWLDYSNYTLVKNGTFEDGSSGWDLSGNASVVSGNEPWNVHGENGSHSLKLGRGASATTSSICVGLEHPTMRFFAKSKAGLLSGGLLSTLRVDVIFEGPLGIDTLPIGLVTANSKWHPTPLPYPVIANLLPLIPGERTAVRFRFTAQGPGEWQIDDVYVDPRCRR